MAQRIESTEIEVDGETEVAFSLPGTVKMIFLTAFQETERRPRENAAKCVDCALSLAVQRGFPKEDAAALRQSFSRAGWVVDIDAEAERFNRFLALVPPEEFLELAGIVLVPQQC